MVNPGAQAWLLITVLALPLGLAGCTSDGARPQPQEAEPALELPRPSVVIEWLPTQPVVGEAVRFSLTITGNATLEGASWTYGDGTSEMALAPSHSYRAAGEYRVDVVAKWTGGGGEATTNLTVDPTAQQQVEPPVSVPPPTLLVNLTGSRIQASFQWNATPTTIFWDMGDGTTGSAPTMDHIYLATGRYEVSLRLHADPVATAQVSVLVEQLTYAPRVIVGVSDSGINPYHETYYRPSLTSHPCRYIDGYNDCAVPALRLSVGPDGGTYKQRLEADGAIWQGVRAGQWYWIPQTNIVAAFCPEAFTGDATSVEDYPDPICILDDTQTHGTQTTSSVLSEAPDAFLVFVEGSNEGLLDQAPAAVDIQSHSWGSVAPIYGGAANPATQALGIGAVCADDAATTHAIKFRSAGNNGPVPNAADCMRSGKRSYSVAGGYPQDQHHVLSGSTPDFASYMCRPTADPFSVNGTIDSVCGTSFAAPTAAGSAAAALLLVRRQLGFTGGNSQDEVAPGVSHEAFIRALQHAATYDPAGLAGFPQTSWLAMPTGPTPWMYWGWGWLDRGQSQQAAFCVWAVVCPDNKSPEAWLFNETRRSFSE